MKNIITALFLLFLTSCGIGNYPLTTFYVKNTSDKSINFKASVLKFSQLNGSYVITQSFEVPPNDSLLVRQAHYKKDAENPQNWFTKFDIFPVDGISLNDPNLPVNWRKYFKNGKPIFTFTLNQ